MSDPIFSGQTRVFGSGERVEVKRAVERQGTPGWEVLFKSGEMAGATDWFRAIDMLEKSHAEPAIEMIEPPRRHSHYFRRVTGLDWIDLYRFFLLFDVTDPCLQHAIKKLVVPGMRGGGKTERKDVEEAVDTLQRWLEIQNEDDAFMATFDDRLPLDADPHAELRKTWAPGQRWQVSWWGIGGWVDCSETPEWHAVHSYRRHPDDVPAVARPSPTCAPLPNDTPWYPDDSGEWVEIYPMPAPIHPDTVIQTLSKRERADKKQHNSAARPMKDWDWGQLVAYKVVKNA